MKTTAATAHILALITAVLVGGERNALCAPSARIGLNFTGADDKLIWAVPDTNGAVGPNHIIELLNDVYSVYDKASGALLQRMSINDFWRTAGLRGPETIPIFETYDPRVVYDPTSERWYAVSLNGFDSSQTLVNVGVSISSDPTFPMDDLTRGWKGFSIDGDPAQPNTRSSDFAGLGFDADGVYITTVLRSDDNQPFRRDRMVVSLPKADLLSSSPTVVNQSVFDLSGADLVSQCAGSTIQPVMDFGPSDGTASLLYVNATAGMHRWEVTGSGVQFPGQATLSGPTPIAIAPVAIAPMGRQPGDTPALFSGSYSADCPSGGNRDLSRFTSALVQQSDSIWGTVAVDAGGRAGVRWYELDSKTGAVRQEGTVSDPHLDLIYPSIAVNPFGDVVIGFTASGENKFASAYAVVGDTVGGVTTFGDLIELKAGTSTFVNSDEGDPYNRWGDYSQTVVDPSDPYSFWTFQEFAQTTNQFAVQITQLLLPGAATRPDVVAIGPEVAYVVRDNIIDGRMDNLGDAASDAMVSLVQRSIQVGETDTNTNRIDRLITKFALPDRGANAGDRLETALLRVFLEGTEGLSAAPLSLLHSQSDNDTNRLKSDYEDASYGDTELELFQPTDEIGRYYEVNVTDLVRKDYAQDGSSPLSAFRLQIDDATFLEDGLSHRYILPSAAVRGRPELLLTFLLTGDFNQNGVLDIGDMDELSAQSAGGTNLRKYDLNADALVNSLDVKTWIKDLKHTYFGDANVDGEFNSSDLVNIFQAGEYEDDIQENSGWATGDWDGDADFTTSDLVLAFQDDGYEQGPRAAGGVAVPEPSDAVLLIASACGLQWLRIRRPKAF